MVSDWPDDVPVACLPWWPAGSSLKGRARSLAHEIGADARVIYDDLLRKNRDIRLSVIVATSHGESNAISQFAEHTVGRSSEDVDPRAAEAILFDGLLAGFMEGIGVHIPGTTISAACASSCVATGLAAERIRAGFCDACFVVSLDVLSRVAHAGFRQIGAMSPIGCRPFDRCRDGTTIGEAGTVFLVAGEEIKLPSEAHAAVRVRGFGQACDARHAVEPTTRGIADAARHALDEARCAPTEVSAVYWHGSGTIQNDRAEAEAACQLFGSEVPPGTATKGAFGHTMGASAALSILAAAETIAAHTLPPVAGLEEPEYPQLRMATDQPMQVDPGPVLVVALGFGGINSALLLGPIGNELSRADS